jgi:hypothetical protein
MLHFYDGQIRRYVTQLVRLVSNFSYKDGKDQLVTVPVMYGDITRQVGSILRDNSENKIPSAPRMGLYITGLEQDRDRTSDASYVHKLNIRERAWDANGQEYLNTQGKNYTVERLMPSPYTLTVNVDLWTTNTDQKLQILEQILTLFNPTLEIQTTDNYVDWASLTVVNLDTVNFSSRSIPTGTESDIDVATLTFSVPIYISPPVKVKRLGVITNIITSIFDESKGNIDLGISAAQTSAWDDGIVVGRVDRDGNEIYETSNNQHVVTTTYQNQGLFVQGNIATLIQNGSVGTVNWKTLFESMPGNPYDPGVSQLHLRRIDLENEYNIVGTIALNTNETQLLIDWDADTLPTDSVISGPNGNRSKIDYIIDPQNFNPDSIKATGVRILLLGPIGDADNIDGPGAWKNADNSDFIASENDIVEWSGTEWVVVFDADTDLSIYGTVYTTNLNTGTQYRFDGNDWLLSVDGEWPRGTWRLSL